MLGKRFVARTIKRVGNHLGLDIRRSASAIGEMDSFLRHVRRIGLVPSSVLDVGANRAEWSRVVRRWFPEARFTLIEPQYEMQPLLEAFCAEVSGSRYYLAGAGPAKSEMVLNVWPDRAGSTVLQPPKSCGYEKRRVPIITIDSLYSDGDELPQLAKLDIQGFELEALAGATKLFGHTECFILEASLFAPIDGIPVFAEVVAFMDERGYKAYDIAGYLRRPLDNALAQLDLAFVRKDGILNSIQRFGSSTA